MNLALGAACSWSIFIRPPEEEFGWTRADISTVFTVLTLVFGLTFVLGGRLQDKLGPKVRSHGSPRRERSPAASGHRRGV